MTSNPVFHFFNTPGNLGPTILRLAVSAFFLYHGAQKAFGWFGGSGWNATVESWAETFGLPVVLSGVVIVGELLVFGSLFFGLFTRLGGLGVTLIMIGALVLTGRGAAFVDLQVPLLLLASGLALFCLGGGLVSLDRAVSRNLLPVVG
ncbi:MAG: DoxX family protein [Terrimicrobiaceae bacterium]|nr:DoxX family protein [Terrimicrobiaceae bacterium]